MGRSLESYGKKSLDADVEKDGAQEINWDVDDKSFGELQDTFSALFTKEELEEISRKNIQKMIAESAEPEPGEELYDAQTLGKATRGVPIQDTLEAEEQNKNMEAQYKEFIEIAEEYDVPNPELEKRFAELVAELEGIF